MLTGGIIPAKSLMLECRGGSSKGRANPAYSSIAQKNATIALGRRRAHGPRLVMWTDSIRYNIAFAA
jgi:hypothetical protein